MSSVAAAPSITGCREALTFLAPLFAWPDERFDAQLERAIGALTDSGAPPRSRSTASVGRPPIVAFAEQTRALDVSAREVTYTSTFDLAPSCSPYVGAHLFGEENRDRSRLLIGLRSCYVSAGQTLSGELPDHIALILDFATRFKEDEWADLLRLVLEPALGKMEQTLAGTANPYRHLVSAARQLCRAAMEEGANA